MNALFNEGYKLIHPETEELVAIFQGYSDMGSEVWLTQNGIEHCKFEGFASGGWTKWSQSLTNFAKTVTELCG